MGTKNNPGECDCYAAAEPDEPMFVLLGRDKHAPALVWLWATLRELDGEDKTKVDEARSCLLEMIKWKDDHGGKSVGLGQAALAAVFELIRAADSSVRNAKNVATPEDTIRNMLALSNFEEEKE